MELKMANTEIFRFSRNMVTALLVSHGSNEASPTDRNIKAMDTHWKLNFFSKILDQVMGTAWEVCMGKEAILLRRAVLTTVAGNILPLSSNRESVIVKLGCSEQKLQLASVDLEICGGIVKSQSN